jgi:hypothetical protein
MRNERGNAIALVLLILAVVSLVGAGALMMSRYDLKFSAALRSYDKGFNLADGGSTLSYRDLAKHDREQSLSLQADYQTNPPTPLTVYCSCIKSSDCSSTQFIEQGMCLSGRCVERQAGDFNSQVQIVDYRTALTADGDGWEAGAYYNENWNGLGVSERAKGRKTSAFMASNTTVQANVRKKKLTGN